MDFAIRFWVNYQYQGSATEPILITPIVGDETVVYAVNIEHDQSRSITVNDVS